MRVSEPARRIEVFAGEGRRRSWSLDEKSAIVAESYAGSDTVCGVARRFGLTPQQLFTWRRVARDQGRVAEAVALFVPAVLEPVKLAPSKAASLEDKPKRRTRRRSAAHGIELEIGGVAVRVGADASPKAIAAVIRALKAGA